MHLVIMPLPKPTSFPLFLFIPSFPSLLVVPTFFDALLHAWTAVPRHDHEGDLVSGSSSLRSKAKDVGTDFCALQFTGGG